MTEEIEDEVTRYNNWREEELRKAHVFNEWAPLIMMSGCVIWVICGISHYISAFVISVIIFSIIDLALGVVGIRYRWIRYHTWFKTRTKHKSYYEIKTKKYGLNKKRVGK
jgi:hypothetical protein